MQFISALHAYKSDRLCDERLKEQALADTSALGRIGLSAAAIINGGYESLKGGVLGLKDMAVAAYEWQQRTLGAVLHADFAAAWEEYRSAFGAAADLPDAAYRAGMNVGTVLGDAETRQAIVDTLGEIWQGSTQISQAEILGKLPMELLIAAGTAGAGQVAQASGALQRLGSALNALADVLRTTDVLPVGTRTPRVVVSRSAGTAPVINPGFPAAGRIDNCVNCVVATDATFAGRPASALPQFDPRGVPISEIPKALGVESSFTPAQSLDDIASVFGEFGPGARGVVFADRGPGQVGHVFNVVVNQRGAVRFWDGQSTTRPTLENQGYKEFRWLRSD